MDESEFQRMLERFPVVRKKTHARVEWNSIVDGASNTKPTVQLPRENQQTLVNSTDSLSLALEKFLSIYFSSQEVAKIQRELEKTQADFLSGLCLEDINDLCAQFVTTKH